MAHTKAIGSTQLGRDSQPKYLGVKLHDGQMAKPGNIIIRQRGTKFLPGKGVRLGHDYTIYAAVAVKIDIEFIRGDVEVIKTDIEQIKHDLKSKIDRSEFAVLERRVALLESRR